MARVRLLAAFRLLAAGRLAGRLEARALLLLLAHNNGDDNDERWLAHNGVHTKRRVNAARALIFWRANAAAFQCKRLLDANQSRAHVKREHKCRLSTIRLALSRKELGERRRRRDAMARRPLALLLALVIVLAGGGGGGTLGVVLFVGGARKLKVEGARA